MIWVFVRNHLYGVILLIRKILIHLLATKLQHFIIKDRQVNFSLFLDFSVGGSSSPRIHHFSAVTTGTPNIGWGVVYISHFIMRRSIPAAPSTPLPPGSPPGISLFFRLGWQIPGVGTLEMSNPPGWGRKKRANVLSSVNTTTFFIDAVDGTVESCHFKHFNVRFFVSIKAN